MREEFEEKVLKVILPNSEVQGNSLQFCDSKMFKILLVVALLSCASTFADAKLKFSDIPVKDINDKTASLPANGKKCTLVAFISIDEDSNGRCLRNDEAKSP